MRDIIKPHSFVESINRIQRFSQDVPQYVFFQTTKTEAGPFGLFDHSVTGKELNELTSKFQAVLIENNERIIDITKEFNEVYKALESLDKDYLSSIIVAVKEAELSSNEAKIASDQAKTASNQALTASEQAHQASNQAKNASEQAHQASNQAKNASDQAVQVSNQAKIASDQAKTASNQALAASNQAREISERVQKTQTDVNKTIEAIKATIETLKKFKGDILTLNTENKEIGEKIVLLESNTEKANNSNQELAKRIFVIEKFIGDEQTKLISAIEAIKNNSKEIELLKQIVSLNKQEVLENGINNNLQLINGLQEECDANGEKINSIIRENNVKLPIYVATILSIAALIMSCLQLFL